MTSWPVDRGVLELGDLPVERGGTIRDARLSWQTHGTLAPARDNVVVYPCSFGATSDDLAWLIGPDGVLDPTRWFVVVPDMFSNGRSSSASQQDDHPAVVTAADNVHAQHRLVTEHFGVSTVAAVYGFSMGGIQAYHWAALYPDEVQRAIVVCGSARTADHNKVFLSGLLRILEAAPEHLGGGRFSAEPGPPSAPSRTSTPAGGSARTSTARGCTAPPWVPRTWRRSCAPTGRRGSPFPRRTCTPSCRPGCTPTSARRGTTAT